MGLGERAKPSNSSVSTTRIRPLSGPHWPWMLLQALSALRTWLRSGPQLQHLVQLHIRTDCGPQGHQLKNPSTTVPAQFARLQLSQWDRHRGTQCASVRCSSAKCALQPSTPCSFLPTDSSLFATPSPTRPHVRDREAWCREARAEARDRASGQMRWTPVPVL